MPKSENQKLKTLYVAKFFMENSDENHAVTANDIIDYLREECGIEAERRSIYRDIAQLRDVFGMDIDGGQGGSYRLLSRQFEFDDLRILAECVHAAKFISANKAKELVETIGEFGSIYQSETLQHDVFLTDRVKSTQKGTLNIISTINAAMATRADGKRRLPTKISFKYLQHTIDDVTKMVERHKGAIYKVSPFQLLINDGNYYLLAFDDGSQEMRTYRIDRMKDVKVLDERRDGHKLFQNIDIRSYTQRVFNMFGGERKRVTMRFELPLLDAAIERFGTSGAQYQKDGDAHFTVCTEVEVSKQFFAWLCQFGTKAKIIAPNDVAQSMKEFLAEIANTY